MQLCLSEAIKQIRRLVILEDMNQSVKKFYFILHLLRKLSDPYKLHVAMPKIWNF